MLSICIPTFNRAPYLAWTLTKLRKDFPKAEIVVSDNASTDETAAWVSTGQGGADFYHRQPVNIGAFPNMYAALSQAKERYAIYCADDDYLLPEQVQAGIDYLEAHPEVAAFCAPCEIWNEVQYSPYWNAFQCEERTFDQRQGIDLFNFLISGHIWPEHIIYRTPVPIKPRTRAYWAFADIPDILDAGAMHFSSIPFYRNLLVHPVGDREQLGNVQCLTYFDEYRAGLEVLAYGLFGHQPYTARRHIQDMIQAFICTRMAVAKGLYEQSGDRMNADMLSARISIANPMRDTV